MWPDQILNKGPLALQSDALQTVLHGPAPFMHNNVNQLYSCTITVLKISLKNWGLVLKKIFLLLSFQYLAQFNMVGLLFSIKCANVIQVQIINVLSLDTKRYLKGKQLRYFSFCIPSQWGQVLENNFPLAENSFLYWQTHLLTFLVSWLFKASCIIII